MTKKADSIIRLTEAIESMGFTMNSTDLHRLHYFTRDTVTRTATVKALRNAVAQFRLDPLKLLEKRGVGVKTLHSVQLLSGLLAGQETQKEFGVADNLAAVQSILNTTHRGSGEYVRDLISKSNSFITHARNALQLEKMGTLVQDIDLVAPGALHLVSAVAYPDLRVTVDDVAGNLILNSNLETLVLKEIAELKSMLRTIEESEKKRFEVIDYGVAFKNTHCLKVLLYYREVKDAIHSPRFEN